MIGAIQPVVGGVALPAANGDNGRAVKGLASRFVVVLIGVDSPAGEGDELGHQPASVERHLGDGSFVDGLLEGAVLGLQSKARRLHLDRLVRPSDLHDRVDSDTTTDIENDIRLAVVLKGGRCYIQDIRTDGKVRKAIEATALRFCHVFYLGSDVGHRHRRILNHSSGAVGNDALNISRSRGLGVPIRGKQKDGDEEEGGDPAVDPLQRFKAFVLH